MNVIRTAHQVQQEAERNGAAAVEYPNDPKVRQHLQSAIHQLNKQYGNGVKMRTRRMFVDGENLLVVWRIK